MSKILLRAFGFALLAFVLMALLSVIAFLVLVGVPDPAQGVNGFAADAAAIALPVDLVVGGIVMLGCGWLAARPFAGRAALIAGLATGACYLLIDVGVIALFGRLDGLQLDKAVLAWAVKLAAATAGGALAARGAVAKGV